MLDLAVCSATHKVRWVNLYLDSSFTIPKKLELYLRYPNTNVDYVNVNTLAASIAHSLSRTVSWAWSQTVAIICQLFFL